MPRTGLAIKGPIPGTDATCQITFEFVRGKPHVRSLTIDAPNPLPAHQLATVSLKDLFDDLYRAAILKQTLIDLSWISEAWEAGANGLDIVMGVSSQLDDAETAALSAARTARRQPRITEEDLHRVLDLHAAKGIRGVMNELRDYDISERSAWRLLARARKELGE